MENIIHYEKYREILESSDLLKINPEKEFKGLHFHVQVRCEPKGLLIGLIPNSHTIDAIGYQKEEFRTKMSKFLSVKLGMEVSIDYTSDNTSYDFFVSRSILSDVISNILKF